MWSDQLARGQSKAEKRLSDLETKDVINPAARYTRASAQTLTSAGLAIINFDTLVVDPRACVATGASWAYTAPVAGVYQVEAAILLAGSTGWTEPEIAYLAVYKNGAAYAVLDYKADIQSNAQSVNVGLSGCTLVNLAAGETLDIRGYQASGGSIALVANAIYNHVSIFKVGS